jgi:hypothetical protein
MVSMIAFSEARSAVVTRFRAALREIDTQL